MKVLVFHRAVGFVHLSIPAAVAALDALCAVHDIEVEATDDPERFTAEHLAGFDVLVFVHTSGDVLPEPSQRTALEGFMADGGGWFGIHAASSMGEEVAEAWPWFRELVGARFTGHTIARLYCDDVLRDGPGVEYAGLFAQAPSHSELIAPGLAIASTEAATICVEQPDSAAAAGLTDGETRWDEWYGFDENPRPWVQVVATVDESTYAPYLGEMGADHPFVWWREFGGGRSVYNSLGHAAEAWHDERFLAGVLGGIRLAAGLEDR